MICAMTNTPVSPLRRRARALALALLLSGAGQLFAADTYDPATRQLTIPAVTIGTVNYADMVVRVGTILSGPSGVAPNGLADSYDPATGRLTVPSVTVGTDTYYNAVVTVARLQSIGSAPEADSYNGSELSIRAVQV